MKGCLIVTLCALFIVGVSAFVLFNYGIKWFLLIYAVLFAVQFLLFWLSNKPTVDEDENQEA